MPNTLYDILELSPTAGADAIRAAYERLAAKYDPLATENLGRPDARMRHDAIKEAFLTLANPAKRLQYDRSIAVRPASGYSTTADIEPFWTWPKIVAAGLIVVAAGGWMLHQRAAEKRLAAEREIAATRAREAEARAREEAGRAEQARIEAQTERQRMQQEQRARAELERSRRDAEREQHVRESVARMEEGRRIGEQASRSRAAQLHQRQVDLDAQRRDEAALDAARRQSAREREELCRMERERYGKALSC